MLNIVERPAVAEPDWKALYQQLEQAAEWLSTEDAPHLFGPWWGATSEVIELVRHMIAFAEWEPDSLMRMFADTTNAAAVSLIEQNEPEEETRDRLICLTVRPYSAM